MLSYWPTWDGNRESALAWTSEIPNPSRTHTHIRSAAPCARYSAISATTHKSQSTEMLFWSVLGNSPRMIGLTQLCVGFRSIADRSKRLARSYSGICNGLNDPRLVRSARSRVPQIPLLWRRLAPTAKRRIPSSIKFWPTVPKPVFGLQQARIPGRDRCLQRHSGPLFLIPRSRRIRLEAPNCHKRIGCTTRPPIPPLDRLKVPQNATREGV